MSNVTPQLISQWLSFSFGKELYVVNMQYIQEVIPYTEPSPIPGSPSHVSGMITLREQIITLNNMQAILGLAESELPDQKRIIVMEFANQVQGMLVGTVGEIIEINKSEIERVNATGDADHIIQGTVERNAEIFIIVSVAGLMKNED